MNDQILTTILSKLNAIEHKIKVIEGEEVGPTDSLYERTLRVMEKHDELTIPLLERELKINRDVADKLLDRLEAAGYGKCYFEEV